MDDLTGPDGRASGVPTMPSSARDATQSLAPDELPDDALDAVVGGVDRDAALARAAAYDAERRW